MSAPTTGIAPKAVVETPVEAVFDENAAQFANDNPVYALIIGNNEYQAPGFDSLSGAVADADVIEGTLKSAMNLSDLHTVSLRNATRQEMLDGFYKLDEITQETEDPCIIIFYAGHGAQTARPKGWEDYATDAEMIELLCPVDLGMVGDDGEIIEGIPDRMVSSLLSNLAAKRGNNITLILDCCHSAGLNRDDEGDRVPRWLHDPPPITAKANVIPEPPAASGVPEGEGMRGVVADTSFGGKYASSHVLLAACGRNKRAYENKKTNHGYFTSALTRFLQGKRVEKETYLSLMHSIIMPAWQTPHCMGVNADRPLFNRRGSRSDPSYIPCKVVEAPKASEEQDGPTFSLLAGLAEGILPGEEFLLYKAVPFEGQKNAGKPFGVMVAAQVGATSTVLQRLKGKDTPLRVPKVFYAKRRSGPDYPASIYCEDETLLGYLTKLGEGSKGRKVSIVDAADKASLILKVEGEDVFFERNDPSLRTILPSPRFRRPVSRRVPEQIQDVIDGWRHFNYHLDRQGPPEYDFPKIRMEMHYLEPSDGDWDAENPDYVPVGENLLSSEPAHAFVSDEQQDRPLGLTLYNDGDGDVYPYLFYFDLNELTITPWPLVAEGAGDGEVDPPLLAHSQLAVGYGTGGADPLKFFFEEGTKKDVGYFKLFITHSPASFRSLNQEMSPFPRAHRGGGEEDEEETPQLGEAERIAEGKKLDQKLDKEAWGVKLNTIIQERRG